MSRCHEWARAAGAGLRDLGLYGHAEAILSHPTPDNIDAAGRALLDVEAAFAAAGFEDWACRAARVAKLLRAARVSS